MSRKFWSLCLAAMLAPGAALAADDTEQGLATLWEVLWHQSGTPTRVVRWENDIRMRMIGVDLAQHREYVTRALRTVTEEAGIRLVDVTEQPGEAANLTVEITPDHALEDNQPCVTYLDFRTESKVDVASIQMRSKDAYRCAYHEAMHLMGVRGHPAGKTVLSYFPLKVDGLMPLDRVMLRAWYSPRMKGGMTPFEALPVLADELIATAPDKPAAMQARDRFFAATIEQMQAYAQGRGDIPAIVKRSGKSTEDGVRHGRIEMSYFLGVAYFEGTTVQADPNLALRWFERAANAGNRRAQQRLAGPR
jgi:TPR repeat protein